MTIIKKPSPLLRAISSLLIFLIISGCGGAKKVSEEYAPSRELIQAKSDQPIIRLWDRWDEQRSSVYRLKSGDTISHESLVALLADDPDSTVQRELESAKTSTNNMGIGTSVMILGALGLVLALSSKKEVNAGVTGAFAGATVAGIGLTVAFDGSRRSHIDSAISAHNARLARDGSTK